jgi:hypothetical protein
MGALRKHGGLSYANIVEKLISFGAYGMNVFQGCVMVLLTKCKISTPPIWKAFITWCITPI